VLSIKARSRKVIINVMDFKTLERIEVILCPFPGYKSKAA
jgi:hypothetical protein